MTDDMYKVCRWCKYYNAEKRMCVNEWVYGDLDDNILYPFWENGHLAEAVKEGFKDFNFVQLEQALFESSLSKKKQAEILKIFREELDDAFVNWTESIDDSVSTALNNFEFELADGIPIADPSEMSCKYFW